MTLRQLDRARVSQRERRYRHVPVFLACLAVLTGGPWAWAQTTSFDCLPPVPPSAALPDLLREYEAELRVEYSVYFDDAQAYLVCLDAAGRTMRADVQATLEAYRRLFPK